MKKIILFLFLLNLFVQADDKSLKIQLRWFHQFQFAGYYAALEKNYYKDAGLDVKLIEGNAFINSVQTVLSKKADIGVSNSSLVIEYLNGKPIVMLGAIFQHSPNVLLTSEKFKSPVDLAKSGTISLLGGDQDIELKAMFIKEGIDLKKVKFVSNGKHLDALLDDEVVAINAYTSNEPFVLNEKNLPYRLLEPRNYGLDFYGDTIFTTDEIVKNNPQKIEKFRKATIQGWEYALKNQEEIIDLILKKYNTQHKTRKQLQFEANVLKQLINPDFVEVGHSNPGRWEHIVETYKLFNLVKNDKSLDAFYYQVNTKVDMTWFYIYIIISFSLILLFGFVLFYIYRINKKLEKTLLRHKILFDNAASAGIVWDNNFAITNWNEEAKKVFGWSSEEVMGKNIFDFLVAPQDLELVKNNFNEIKKDQQLYLFINKNVTKDGRTILCEWHNTILPKIDPHDKQEVVSLAIDITQRDKEEKALKQQALHDPLTSLPNRNHFELLLNEQLKIFKEDGFAFCVGFIDLDGFKNINDTFGHESGDYLLITLANRFQDILRDAGNIARMGGDEFAFIIKTDNYENYFEMLLDVASTQITHNKNEFQVTASIGVYFICDQKNETISEILKKADISMYNAKKSGKNQYQIYNNIF
ncbi:MAG: ABC transporter substrate-binding protein [Arcobacteraceae bacterium]|nr:ABC transporter substrate-binding protein [Arcobacteraceae bacterium]